MDDHTHVSIPFNGFDLDNTLHYSASTSKQIISLLTGAAVHQGILRLDMGVSNFLPDAWIRGNVLEHATVEDLLNSEAGLMPDTAPMSISVDHPLADVLEYVTASSLWRVNDFESIGIAFPDGISVLLRSLYSTDGTPIQYRVDGNNANETLVDQARPYVPRTKSPRAYSSISYCFAGIALQMAVEKFFDANANSTVFFETWARDTLFAPLGYPDVRISGDGRYVYPGGAMYAPHNFYIEMMKLVLDKGMYNGRRIVDATYANELLVPENYAQEKTYSDYLYRGLWGDFYESHFAVGFAGNGGMQTIGMPTSTTGRRIVSSSRRSFASPPFLEALSNVGEPLVEDLSVNEYIGIFAVHRTNDMFAYVNTTLRDASFSIGLLQAAPLDGPLYSYLHHTLKWWDDMISNTFA
jgi:CubicO group peptidase (beta-lactamase class C family)